MNLTQSHSHMHWQTCTLSDCTQLPILSVVSLPLFEDKTTRALYSLVYVFAQCQTVICYPVKASIISISRQCCVYIIVCYFVTFETDGIEKWYDKIHRFWRSKKLKLFMKCCFLFEKKKKRNLLTRWKITTTYASVAFLLPFGVKVLSLS